MRKDPAELRLSDEDGALYIHLANDGAVFLVRWNGEQLWTDQRGLAAELEAARSARTKILYTRESPQQEPPACVVAAFRLIRDSGLPIQILDQPHPHALAPVSERRTVVNPPAPRPGPA